MNTNSNSTVGLTAKAAIVVPTIRHGHISRFLDAWRNEFENHLVIIVEDNPERTVDMPYAEDVLHYSWREIDEDLGKNSWIIPRRTDCIRSYGFLKAWQRDVDFVVSLDDDCLPSEANFLAEHWENLRAPATSSAWVSTVQGAVPRGYPYFATTRSLRCALSHGLWRGVMDFDAITQLNAARLPFEIGPINQVIPRGTYFPMCGMNVAFRAELAPIMYFLLMGKEWPYDRFGDIWCGVFAKRICDHLGIAVKSGRPFVRHERASNVWINLIKESTGYEMNESLWQFVDSIVLSKDSLVGCYREIAERLTIQGEYWSNLRLAMCTWADLFAAQDSIRDAHVAAANA